MHRVFLIIGGNLGDREALISETAKQVRNTIGRIINQSDIYETEPWGFEHDVPFLNRVLEVETSLEALCLLDACQQIENNLGRTRDVDVDAYTARTVDIDVLFYDDCVYTLPPLVVPHRKLHERLFVLKPLAQIAPNFVHPLLCKTVSELLAACTDTTKVWQYAQVEHESVNK
ncbi:MAG TPA: 2-amino-4-hydroxy-6-hydroxymethyldihydropteridine diphosphokinase [Tenuifilaceae bacterium]|nr:2-amino-4-hydroxy-6-hydroxymethyldihydropteridine diphosphokinase [Tenuifilaceae bacterium]